MKKTRGNTEEKEPSLAEIRTLMETTPCCITPRPQQVSDEDREVYGRNTDREHAKFNEETGQPL